MNKYTVKSAVTLTVQPGSVVVLTDEQATAASGFLTLAKEGASKGPKPDKLATPKKPKKSAKAKKPPAASVEASPTDPGQAKPDEPETED